ncbi:hypothetical protein QTN47_24540 [Danxiaibacter flavus]|uniref:Carboxypeptidase regulatory-like domain-containing protein n=1 Tax=Danxiaibacter flavus TaxID=3049108 RepID=A0ABV3ZLJ0_9BACT|nr:hypothetical protein QNM32_24545 [Chitinophagaceae bacterium DXS]
MKHLFQPLLLLFFLPFTLAACSKSVSNQKDTDNSSGEVDGKVMDENGNPLQGVKTTIEHTVWYDTYLYGVTDNSGKYSIKLPAEPAGTWTAKAQIERSAYGQDYKFDLQADNTDPFDKSKVTTRNFTWKLSGPKPGNGGFYGAHVDLYAFGTDVDVTQIKLILTPLDTKLIDGSAATSIEKTIKDVAGTFMATDIPIGRYSVKAIYAGKKLLLDNRHDNGEPAESKEVIFGKNGTLGETEYNIEFWISE